ncbi:DUF2968 domain-containing protein [Cupriavidus basilensis]|uniref:DUF2968 domain-containing protein n=1 Tax=Cupriavidus basilensis TaxID=68895 RepID=A0ABT6AVK7_9BURK|nr:DUF2968 domain-containing protein [Cupriavidus basilensis]MDF3836499.1 DUF2968 domain-containing protein [Cupriavidus basilensis]
MLNNSCRATLLASLTGLTLSLSAAGAFAAAEPVPPSAALAPLTAVGGNPRASAASLGLVSELQQRLRDRSVRELRTSYNGDYGTTLMLADDQVVCYVALFYQKNLWRVFRFESIGAAEQAYRQVTQQSAAWASDDIRRQVLASQKRAFDKALQETEARANALNEDVRVMQAQRQRIAEEQKASRIEVQSAEIESRASRLRLEQLQEQIRRMESSLSDAGLAIPGVPSNSNDRPLRR